MKLKNITLIFSSFLIACFFMGVFLASNTNSVDPSFDNALRNNVEFGDDFIAPIGPLGFLLSGVYSSASPSILILLNAILLFSLMFALYTVLSRGDIAITLRVIVLSLLMTYGEAAFLLLAILVILFFEFIESRKSFLLPGIVIICAIALLIDIRIGLTALVLFVGFIIFLLVNRLLVYWQAALCLVGYILLELVLTMQVKTNLISYFDFGLSLMSGYSDFNHTERGGTSELIDFALGIGSLLLLIVPFFLFIRKFYSDKQTFFSYLIILTLTFFLFATSFSADQDFVFFNFLVPITGILVFYSRVERTRIFYYSLLPISILSIVFLLRHNDIGHRVRAILRPDVSVKKYANLLKDNSSLINDSITLNSISQSGPMSMPDNTVDFFPDERASKYQFDHSRKLSRPVAKSKWVTTYLLDNVNADFVSKNGPEFIVMAPISENRRYFLFDEPKTKLEILKNYRTIGKSTKDVIVLQRRVEPIYVTTTPIAEDEFHFRDTIALASTDEIQIVYPHIEYSMLGRIFKFLFWAPNLYICLTLNDGSVREFKFPKSLGKSGVMINKFVEPENVKDFEFFINYFGRLSPSIRSLHFSTRSYWAFSSKISIRTELVSFGKDIVPAEARFRPIEITSSAKISESPNIRANIESLNIDKTRVDIFGWVFNNDSTHSMLRPALYLEASNHSFSFPFSKKFTRSDVKAVFGKNVGDSAGFAITFYKEFLRNANYKLGFAYLNNDNSIADKMFVGGVIIKNSDSISSPPLRRFIFSKNDFEGVFNYNLEKLEISEREITAGGWAYLDSKIKTRRDSLKLVLKSIDSSSCFVGTLDPLPRKDVAEYFKNDALIGSGFHKSFSSDGMRRGTYALFLYSKDPETKNGIYQFVKNVSIGFPNFFLPTVMTKSLGSIKNADSVRIEVENISDSHDVLRVSGWAFMPNETSWSTYVLLKSEGGAFISETKKVFRPDVTAYFEGKQNLDNSGFEAIISKKGLPKGSYEIGIYLVCNDERSSFMFLGEYCTK